MTDPSTPAGVHGTSVYVGEVLVGSVSGVFVGVEVEGLNGRRWFLPWAACSVEGGAVTASSALVFIASDQVDFYARHGVRMPKGGSRDLLGRG